ncbi:unannotated protein [freshwater metagenome]|uniref:Unannotated protein n=1 Tax=freshwater metagenome TaxID=449393 RepID=A0A6J7D0Y5_9ZZZZ
MKLEGRCAVLEFILPRMHGAGQFARLAHRNESRPQVVSKCSPIREPASLDADDMIDLNATDVLSQAVNDDPKSRAIRHDPAEILEGHAVLRPIRNRSDAGPDQGLITVQHGGQPLVRRDFDGRFGC